MSKDKNKIYSLLERTAVEAVLNELADDGTAAEILNEIAGVSTAISLKRIADALTAPTNEYGENFAEAIGGNIKRALQ